MECVEAALKTSFRKEMALKPSPQAFLEDIWVVNGQNGVSCDDFSVDDLFDFSNEEGFLQQKREDEEDEEEEEVLASSSLPKRQKLSQDNTHFSNDSTTNFDYGSLSTNELAVPVLEKKKEAPFYFKNFFAFAIMLRLLMVKKGAVFTGG